MTADLRAPLRDVDAAMRTVLDRIRADLGAPGIEVELRVDPGFAVPGGVDDRSPAHHVVGVIRAHVLSAG